MIRPRKIAVPLLVMLAVGLIVSLCPKRGHADGIPPVSPNTPPTVAAIADGFHPLSNGSLLTLRDVKNGVWGLGTATAIYKRYYVSSDAMLGYIPSVPDANGFYGLGGRVWLGQLLYDKVAFVHTLADQTAFTAVLLQYGTIGYWGTRDFQNGLWRHGPDAGLTVKFDYLGNPTSVTLGGS